jgi:hypothetical protein
MDGSIILKQIYIKGMACEHRKNSPGSEPLSVVGFSEQVTKFYKGQGNP